MMKMQAATNPGHSGRGQSWRLHESNGGGKTRAGSLMFMMVKHGFRMTPRPTPLSASAGFSLTTLSRAKPRSMIWAP